MYLIDLDKNLKPILLTTIDMNQSHDLVKQTKDTIIFANIDEENIITTVYNYNLKTHNLSKIITFNGLQNGLFPNVSPDGKQMVVGYDLIISLKE